MASLWRVTLGMETLYEGGYESRARDVHVGVCLGNGCVLRLWRDDMLVEIVYGLASIGSWVEGRRMDDVPEGRVFVWDVRRL